MIKQTSRLVMAMGVFLVSTSLCLAASKDSYIQKADKEVQEWSTKLKDLEQRSEKNGAKTRQELDQGIKAADEKLAVARRKLDDLKASNEGTWKSVRKGFDEAIDDVKSAYHKAQSLFNKK